MENEKTDNERNKPKRVIKCELCNQLFTLAEVKDMQLSCKAPADLVFEPFICDPCYQELDF